MPVQEGCSCAGQAMRKMNMKILHTSAWHLGHTLYNYDRTEEQEDMLRQMVRMVREQQPDVFLLCGDVYHTPQPSAAVQTMFANALTALHEAQPEMTLIVTAGNHDSGSKHDIFRTPWKALNVHTIGSVDAERMDDLVVAVPGKGYVAAVPYTHERNLPKGFFQRLSEYVEARNTEGLPVVLTAHTTVRGCDPTGHENASEYTVGGIDAYDLGELGRGYDYVALGHIHRAQTLPGSQRRARYCGTPLPVSFDETYPHSVTLVELSAHGEPPTVRTLDLRVRRPLVTLPTTGTADWKTAKRLLADYPDDLEAYIRLNVEVDGFLPPEATAEAQQLTTGKKCRFCLIQPHRREGGRSEAKRMSVQEFRTEQPMDIARRYAEDLGIGFDAGLQALFQTALDLMEEEHRK